MARSEPVAWRFWLADWSMWSDWSVDDFFRRHSEQSGYRAEYAYPPAEQASGELLADLELVWHSVSDSRETNAAYERLKAALSQRPVVDEAMKARTRDWLATHGGYWDNDYVTRLLTAALSPQQPEKGEG